MTRAACLLALAACPLALALGAQPKAPPTQPVRPIAPVRPLQSLPEGLRDLGLDTRTLPEGIVKAKLGPVKSTGDVAEAWVVEPGGTLRAPAPKGFEGTDVRAVLITAKGTQNDAADVRFTCGTSAPGKPATLEIKSGAKVPPGIYQIEFRDPRTKKWVAHKGNRLVVGGWRPTMPAMNCTDPNPLNTGNKIFYSSSEPSDPDDISVGASDIWVMNADGTGKERRTFIGVHQSMSGPVAAASPCVSPDGTKVLYVKIWAHGNPPIGHYSIYSMLASGGVVNLLSESDEALDMSPRWSADGSRIIFKSFRDGQRWAMYTMNPDGSGQTRLATSSAASSESPDLDPTGNKVAFTRYEDGTTHIYVMALDHSSETKITTGTKHSHSPRWCPTGNRIAFVRTVGEDNTAIYTMNADGTELTRLTNNTKREGNPEWSPDGSKIVFHRFFGEWKGFDTDYSQDGVYIMNADGSGQTRIATPGVNGNYHGCTSSPSW